MGLLRGVLATGQARCDELHVQGVAGIVKERIAKAAAGQSSGQRPMLLFPEVSVKCCSSRGGSLACGSTPYHSFHVWRAVSVTCAAGS